jgi:SulP family sulfate permease|tara:strand:+ start:2328 stop:3938 length:1611 start_codon:yes stop_codon:yes gene_type:complete
LLSPPKIKSFSFFENYNLTNNPKADILSGLTVALALVPEAIAFAFVAQIAPIAGLYAAFFLGLITSTVGGRSGMISGATGATAVAMVGLVVIHGAEYLFAALVVTGLIQIATGLFKLGKFIKLVPYTVMLGFVNGLAIVIFLAQLGQFKIFSHESSSKDIDPDKGHSAIDVIFSGGWMEGSNLLIMIGLTVLTMLIIWLLPKVPKVGKVIPAPLASIILISGVALVLNLDTRNVGDLASVSGGFPVFHIPSVPLNLSTLFIVLPFSLTIAGIGIIESLLTLTLVDEITDTKGNPNQECVGQGIANFVCGFFKSMGGCAMIGQTMINMESGGRGRLSGISAAIFLLGFILFFSTLIEMIPLAALTGIMMMVVIGTFAWPSLKLLTRIPKLDAFVIILVTGVTVAQDLAIAVVIGVLVSCLVHAWKSSQQIEIKTIHNQDGSKSHFLNGVLFFGTVWKFKNIILPDRFDETNVIIDCSNAKLADSSALEAINSQMPKYNKTGKTLQLTNLGYDSLKLIKKAKPVLDIKVTPEEEYKTI